MNPALQEALIDYTGHNLQVLQLSKNKFLRGFNFKILKIWNKISHENKWVLSVNSTIYIIENKRLFAVVYFYFICCCMVDVIVFVPQRQVLPWFWSVVQRFITQQEIKPKNWINVHMMRKRKLNMSNSQSKL